MNQSARKILLPSLVVTELANETDEGTVRVNIPVGDSDTSYYVRPKQLEGALERIDGKPRWMGYQFNLFPVVLDRDGAPWAEANVYLLSLIENTPAPVMGTYANIAQDLAAYRCFLDDTDLDWTIFPSQKLNRPTYRYRGHLKLAIAAGKIAATTAKRRMSVVIRFYTWLKKEKVLTPEHAPWKETDHHLELRDVYGSKYLKRVTTTDISIHISKQVDPYADTIEDGGQLRPLPRDEQEWLMDALITLGNTELTLIHLLGLLTGARIQTILTFQVKHVLADFGNHSMSEVCLPIGPGTGIDTKNDKQLVLHIPIWFYEMLRTYAHSERAQRRRKRAIGGDKEDQYLFLSVRGAPLYYSKEHSSAFHQTNKLRHAKIGQGVRTLIHDDIIPFIRIKYNTPNFHYKFHDTRATFGMNLTDFQLELVAKGEITLNQAREFVKTRMGHASSSTTDLYLQYRHNLKLIKQVNTQYDSHLKKLSEQAMTGLK